MAKRDRVLSGMRPTGKLHLGNYLGALENWVKLQDSMDCFYFVADWHVLTDTLDISEVPRHTIEMTADWLGAGLDPERSTLFVQSLMPEHAELHLLLSMVTPVSWVERVPTYKERIEQLHLESPSYGLLGYPVLQAADIVMYRANWVPVGVDQVPHIELTREVARRFNQMYCGVSDQAEDDDHVKLGGVFFVPRADVGIAGTGDRQPRRLAARGRLRRKLFGEAEAVAANLQQFAGRDERFQLTLE